MTRRARQERGRGGASLPFAVAALAVAAGLTACSAQRFVAPHDDYEAYRRVRTAGSLGARLRAADAYLVARPQGAFADELRALFRRDEETFFAAAQESRDRALEYLSFLPAGPHAEAVQALLLAFDTKLEEGEAASLAAAARRTEATFAGAAAQRATVGEVLFVALAATVDRDLYGKRRDELPASARRFLSGASGATWGPMPTDVTRELFFVVPTTLDRESRVVGVRLALELDGAGRVVASEVRGTNLFVHYREADAMAPLDPTLEANRRAAALYARERLQGFFEATAPEARCGAGPKPGLILHRACDGWEISVRASASPVEDDIVRVAYRP